MQMVKNAIESKVWKILMMVQPKVKDRLCKTKMILFARHLLKQKVGFNQKKSVMSWPPNLSDLKLIDNLWEI